MAICSFVWIMLLVALVVSVFSQSYPRFEFRGKQLTNNSYIPRGNPNTTGIGDGPDKSLRCVTDYSKCCNNEQVMGNWYDDTGRKIPQGRNGSSHPFYVTRGSGVVYLNRIWGGSSGMWRCDIFDSAGTQQNIYIYLGTREHGIL